MQRQRPLKNRLTNIMYINNTTKAPIKNVSYEGYWFTLPVGVSLVWDKFGAFITKHYQPEGDGGSIPPVLPAVSGDWDGKKYAEVRRFEINGELIPNKKELMKIGKARGIDAATLEAWEEDETLETKEIANQINELEVPEFIKYPEAEESAAPAKADKVDAAAEADKLLGPDADAPAPKVTTPAPKKAAAGSKKAAAKAPGTPKKAAAPKK